MQPNHGQWILSTSGGGPKSSVAKHQTRLERLLLRCLNLVGYCPEPTLGPFRLRDVFPLGVRPVRIRVSAYHSGSRGLP
jgi:hypothetical protein